MQRPTIDTSLATIYPSSVSRGEGSSSHPLLVPETRTRSLSAASSSSSISVTSPGPSSSGNPSSSSLHLPSSGMRSSTDQSPSSSSRDRGGDEESPELADDPQLATQEEYVLAMHDFVPQHQNATCLSFRAGEKIRVLNRDASGWWDGELGGRRGWFPSNYVNKTVISLMSEEMPLGPRFRKGHGYSISEGSLASRLSADSGGPDAYFAQLPGEDPGGDIIFPGGITNCPPLMIPLLHGLQLLQNTALSRRISHYQPSVACIIQCLRSILQATECLPRESPMLKRHPVLAHERKRVLSDLASLVRKAKEASADYEHEEEREVNEEAMLRLAGQVFARVRRFLAVAVQCGIELPQRKYVLDGPGSIRAESKGLQDDDTDGYSESDEVFYPVTTQKPLNGSVVRSMDEPDRQSYALSAQSSDDFRDSKRSTLEEPPSSADSVTPLIKAAAIRAAGGKFEPHRKTGMPQHVVVHHRYRSSHTSISSSSSFSSSSSMDSPGTPMTPPFPEGPCTPAQVLTALRSTHDNLLSTIAAFIGHVHSHSRSAHASSIGHLYELVRQVVEIVCKLLTIVEAVMQHKDVPWMKVTALENAKQNLYQMACALADAVRDMATNPSPNTTEEEERGSLLRLATDALKAGSDCVTVVKTCLTRPLGAGPFIVTFPSASDAMTPPPDGEGFGARIASNDVTGGHQEEEEIGMAVGIATGGEDEEEDITIQPASAIIGEPPEPPSPSMLAYARQASREESMYPPGLEGSDINDALSQTASSSLKSPNRFIVPLRVDLPESYEPESDLPSPSSEVLTDTEGGDDGTTWEGSQRQHGAQSLEEKLINGELPSIPRSEQDTPIPLSWALSNDYRPQDVAYNSEGHLVGATLDALIEKMTPHDSIVDAVFSAIFFMTFRLFSTSSELAERLTARFNIEQPQGLSEMDLEIWMHRKQLPVRLRVSNFVKLWLESYWRPRIDDHALPLLKDFVRGPMSECFAAAALRLEESIDQRMHTIQPNSPVSERIKFSDRVRDAGMPINPPFVSPSEIPRPIMTKTLFSALRAKNFASIQVTDFDALELARQLTIMECNLYCAITAEEVLEMGQSGAPPAVNVKAVSALSTAITGWVSESILDETDIKKRTLLVKFFIKVADRCTSLHNFSTPRSILAALDSSTISRLHQTWMGLSQKSKATMESLRKLADHARNYHEYRSRLRNTAPPAVPFLGLYLTDLTFCREGNPSHRVSPTAPELKLINFNKYHKLARIVQDMQRFQNKYNLKEIPEAQLYLGFCVDKVKDHGDLEDLYMRSQKLEPKQPAETPTSDLKTFFGWGTRSHSSSHTSQATLVS